MKLLHWLKEEWDELVQVRFREQLEWLWAAVEMMLGLVVFVVIGWLMNWLAAAVGK